MSSRWVGFGVLAAAAALAVTVAFGGSHASAAGLPTAQSPGPYGSNVDGSPRSIFTAVSACYTSSCQKSRNSFVYVYVPNGTSTFNIEMEHGCFEKGVDQALFYGGPGGNYEENSASTYTAFNMYYGQSLGGDPEVISPNFGGGNLLGVTTKQPGLCNPGSGPNIYRSVTFNQALAPLITIRGASYHVLVFHARANTTFFYFNQFRVDVDSGVVLGMSDTPITMVADGEIAYTTVSSTAAFGAQDWKFTTAFAPPCQADGTNKAYTGTFTAFDADVGVYEFPADNFSFKITAFDKATRNPIGVLQSGTFTGGDASTQDFTTTYHSNEYYELEITGIAPINSQQFKLPFDQIYAQEGACAAVQHKPAPAMTASCDAAGTLTAIMTNASDPDGGDVTATVTSPAGAPPQSGAGPTFVFSLPGQPRDGLTKTASGTVSDAQTGELVPVSATYACPTPPPSISCSIVAPPDDLEPGDTYSPQIYIVHTGPQYSPPVTENAKTVVNGQTSTKTGIVLAQGTSTTATLAPPVTFATAGIYTINGSVTGTLSQGCGTAQITISQKPYVRIYGGEVVAGTSLDTCSSVNSSINGWAKKVGANWVGAGAQFGAYANDKITDFATAILSAPATPSALAFANTKTPPFVTPVFGGSFGSAFCQQTFLPAVLPTVPHTTSIDTFVGDNGGAFILDGGVLTQSAPLKKSVTIYATGDVTIGSNIRTDTGPAWTNPLDIPVLYIIARGNIYIEPGVSEVDGVLAAVPTNANDGRIYTCYVAAGPTDGALIAQNCGTKLTVNGALVSAKVNFTRVNGSLHLATAGEPASGANIAETIQFAPELLIANPALNPLRSSFAYDSITALSPSL